MADASNNVNQQTGGVHTSIEISVRNVQLTAFIINELDQVPDPHSGWCIYKVHEKVRSRNYYSYTPEMVSIGPFHANDVTLLPMRDHKMRYMNALLSRTGNREAKLHACIEAISLKEINARRCYSESVEPNRNKFIQMMIVDGLFTIELFRKTAWEVSIDKDDPIFNTWGISSLVRDMILLENQLPMFVLQILFDITTANQGGRSLNELAIRFFDPLMHRDEHVLRNCFNEEGEHLLDLLRKTFKDCSREGKIIFSPQVKLAPSVTELQQAGVKFRKGSDASSFLDIRFTDGVLEIPPILIQDQTESLLRNFIASEQYCDGSATCITSYAILMDNLINSARDVEFLRNNGIIKSYIGNSGCVYLFNKLCSEVSFVNFHYSDLCDQLTKYHRTPWRVWKTTLERDYFITPWRIMSVVAAVLLLLLTFTATLFAILSFSIHKS